MLLHFFARKPSVNQYSSPSREWHSETYHIIASGSPVPGGHHSHASDRVHGHLRQSLGKLSDFRHLRRDLQQDRDNIHFSGLVFPRPSWWNVNLRTEQQPIKSVSRAAPPSGELTIPTGSCLFSSALPNQVWLLNKASPLFTYLYPPVKTLLTFTVA